MTKARLVHCDRGALTMAGIIMVFLLVALLYMVLGFGNVLTQREGLQDAADAAAFSSAVFHARGMNLIAFINLLMAYLVAVLIALRVTQSLFVIATTALTGAAYFSAGATAPLAIWTATQAIAFSNYYEQAKKIIDPVLEGLHTTQQAASVVVPWVAMTEGMIEAAVHHPPAEGAFAMPGAVSLPIEPDEFSVLCGKGAGKVADLALAPLGGVADLIEDEIESVGEKTSGFLCGDGSTPPPTHSQTYDKAEPEAPGAHICTDDPDSAECRSFTEEVQEAAPGEDGECNSARCGYYDMYEMIPRKARRACDPSAGNLALHYTWQLREGEASFVYDGETWQLLERTKGFSRLQEKTAMPPCGHPYSSVDPFEYNLDSGTPEQEEPDPLCRWEDKHLEAVIDPPVGLVIYDVPYREAVRIFSCSFERTKVHDLAKEGDALGGESGRNKSPHRVESGVKLGDEAFQIRAISFGDRPDPGQESKDAVVLTTRGKEFNSGARGFVMELGQTLGSMAVAQAEFYFAEKPVPREEWLWNMNWRARLKRFHMPRQDEQEEEERRRDDRAAQDGGLVSQFGGLSPDNNVAKACEMVGAEGCGEAEDSLEGFDRWVIH